MSLIPELPESERPRERLARLGAGALSEAELLAIFLRVGVRGASAIDIGRQLLHKYGGLNALGALSVKQLAAEHGLGPAKAAQLKAAFELGSRCASETMQRTPMNSAEAIYQAMAPRLAHQPDEHVVIILLDTKLQAIRTVDLSEGNANTALCEPRDLLHHVLISRAPAFALVHNHPSGDPSPSRQDLSLTRKLQQAAELMHLRFVDHVIIGRPAENRLQAYHSFNAAGIL